MVSSQGHIVARQVQVCSDEQILYVHRSQCPDLLGTFFFSVISEEGNANAAEQAFSAYSSSGILQDDTNDSCLWHHELTMDSHHL